MEALRAEVRQEIVRERLGRAHPSTTTPVPHRLVLGPRMTEVDVDE
jgi:hypothetical protein